MKNVRKSFQGNDSKVLRLTLGVLLAIGLSACTNIPTADIDSLAAKTAKPIVATYRVEKQHFTPTATQVSHTPTPDEPIETSTDFESTTPQNLDPQQVLRYYALSEPDQLDPSLITGTGIQIASEAFVGLTRTDEVALTVQAGMADKWEVSENGLIYTYHLREQVHWVTFNPKDGNIEQVLDDEDQPRLVTAADFEFGIKRTLSASIDSPHASLLFGIKNAQAYHQGEVSQEAVGVKAIDEYTLVVELARPLSYLNLLLDLPFTAAQPHWQNEVSGLFGGLVPPYSYGPFVATKWLAGKSITLTRNPYWTSTSNIPTATLKEVNLIFSPSLPPLQSFDVKGLDVVALNTIDLWEAQGDPNKFRLIHIQPGNCISYYGYNTSAAPFDDPMVRKAFSAAINRDELVNSIIPGNSRAANWYVLPTLWNAPSHLDYPTLGIQYAPETAQKLLSESSYGDANNLPRIFLDIDNSGLSKEIAVSVMQMWVDTLGVEVFMRALPPEYHTDLLMGDNPPQIWGAQSCATVPDALMMLEQWSKGSSTAPFEMAASHWQNANYEQILADAHRAESIPSQMDWIVRAEHLLSQEDSALIPIFEQQRAVLVNPALLRTYAVFPEMERFEKWAKLLISP